MVSISLNDLSQLEKKVIDCQLCPRLVDWRKQVAKTRRAAYADQVYWGKPVPGFGDPTASLLLVGLAPSAHGANRTGRMFTGDRSGDWLYRSLFRAGLANQSNSEHRGDGLRLRGVWITAAARCCPPLNRLSAEETDNCRPFLVREINLIKPTVMVALGGIAHRAVVQAGNQLGWYTDTAIPKFGHGNEYRWKERRILLDCYHPSPQNTSTGRLTEPMLDQVMHRARELAGL